MPLFQREPQVSPGMFVTHVDSEPTPSGAKSEGLEWHPGDSDAGHQVTHTWRIPGVQPKLPNQPATLQDVPMLSLSQT